MDAQEIKSAVAHQDAAHAAAEAPFVNLADPARVLGSDGLPAVSRRAPLSRTTQSTWIPASRSFATPPPST